MAKEISLIIATTLALAGGHAAARQDGEITIARDDCARLVAHRPAANVTYQPGVDVRGEAVAPADLNGAAIDLPDVLVIDLTVDLADRLGIPADPDNFQADLDLGTVELRGDRAYFDGEPLEDEAQAELIALCRSLLSGPR